VQQSIVPGVSLWSRWQPDRSVFFNSHFIETPEGNLIVDPLPPDDVDLAEIEARGGAAWVVLTNRDHERDAAAVAARFGAKVAAPAGERDLFTVAIDRLLEDGDRLCGARVIQLEGMKSPAEIALAFDRLQTVLVGDALWGNPAGALQLPPRVGDEALALASLRRLADRRPRHLLVGDGAAIYDRAYEAIHRFLESRTTFYSNRINLDELPPPLDDGSVDPEGFRAFAQEIGFLIGSEKLGYQIATVPPGESICPMHWHGLEEELFLIIEGSPTLLAPRGEFTLRRGDVIAFPPRESGAHRVVNRGSEAAKVLMISNPQLDVCIYPDSKKVLVEAADIIVRTEPDLAYYDGETAV
jgi:uncharacterized cupin superfamily protein/glyoxylase-like metal-dependent hydrolase (beta-lactamase superfamily II)